jgi:hypothetical protein
MLSKRVFVSGVVILAFVGLLAVRARISAGADVLSEVQGRTILSPATGNQPLQDASKVVVWLVPLMPVNVPAVRPGEYEMLQHNKKFYPDLLVVPIGSLVAFPNADPWFHNVFSLYRGKRFDLGLYQAGDTKFVKFDKPGASYIFCNIHPQMAAVILTVDSTYFGLTDRSGHVLITDVPPGRYRMRVWYENADQAALPDLSRDVVVGGEDHTLPPVSIQVVPHDLRAHKNKYGRDYDTGALAPAY